MTNQVDFLPFAAGVGANVLDQSDYAALPAIATGFQAGLATSNQVNKTWRQSSFVAAAIANFISQQLAIDVLDDGNLSNFIANLVDALNTAIDAPAANINYLPPGTGGQSRTVQDKLTDFVSVLDYMTAAQRANCLAGTGSIDVTAAVQAAANASPRIFFPAGAFLIGGNIALTPDHQVVGAGMHKTVITGTSSTATFVQSTSYSVAGTPCGLLFQDLKIQATNAIKIGSTVATSTPLEYPRFIRVWFLGNYTSSSGDAAFNTQNVRNTSNNLVSSLSGTNQSVPNSFADVSTYGVGLWMNNIYGALIDQCYFNNLGVGHVLSGCDLNVFRKCRWESVGWYGYELYDSPSSTGSQNGYVESCEFLTAHRAGGLVFYGTVASYIHNAFFENPQNSNCFFWWANTRGCRLEMGNRFADPWYYNQLNPLGIIQNPGIGNVIEGNYYDPYQVTNGYAPINNQGSSGQDSNHPVLVSLSNNNAAFSAFQTLLPGFQTGPADPTRFDPTNCAHDVGGNFTPLWQVLNGENVVYNAGTIFPTVKLDCSTASKIAYNLEIRALVASGTTINFTVEHHRQDGTLAESLLAGVNVGGFVAGTFQTVTQALTFGQEPRAGDYILVTWLASSCQLKGLRLY